MTFEDYWTLLETAGWFAAYSDQARAAFRHELISLATGTRTHLLLSTASPGPSTILSGSLSATRLLAWSLRDTGRRRTGTFAPKRSRTSM